jgi:hypothetical protein
MTTSEKKHEVREHLAVISTEVYLLLKAATDDERLERYNIVQEQIDAILHVMDDTRSTPHSSADALF